MTLGTGSIKLSQVAVELGVSATGLSLGRANVRTLAQAAASGSFSMSSLRGKSAYTPMSGRVPDAQGYTAGDSGISSQVSINVGIVLSGGSAPYSYVWSHVSGEGTVTLVNSANTTAKFTVPKYSVPGTTYTQVVQCVVTDSTSATLTRSGTVTLDLT